MPSIAAWVRSRENSLSSGVSFGLISVWRSTTERASSSRIAFRRKSALVKDFRGDALLFAQDSEQQVLGADMPMIQSLRFFGGIRQNSFALIRKRQIDRRRHLLANRRSSFNLLANALDRGMNCVGNDWSGSCLRESDPASRCSVSIVVLPNWLAS